MCSAGVFASDCVCDEQADPVFTVTFAHLFLGTPTGLFAVKSVHNAQAVALEESHIEVSCGCDWLSNLTAV